MSSLRDFFLISNALTTHILFLAGLSRQEQNVGSIKAYP
jgi:hypothetical protein